MGLPEHMYDLTEEEMREWAKTGVRPDPAPRKIAKPVEYEVTTKHGHVVKVWKAPPKRAT